MALGNTSLTEAWNKAFAEVLADGSYAAVSKSTSTKTCAATDLQAQGLPDEGLAWRTLPFTGRTPQGAQGLAPAHLLFFAGTLGTFGAQSLPLN